MLDKVLARMTDADKAVYEPMMRKVATMSADPKKGSSTDKTTAAITDALTAASPRIRYRVGPDCQAAYIISLLPYGLQDWLKRKIYGL